MPGIMRAYLILSPAFIEDHVHDNAGEAHVILNHHLELRLILLLLCKTVTECIGVCRQQWMTITNLQENVRTTKE